MSSFRTLGLWGWRLGWGQLQGPECLPLQPVA